MSGTIYLIHFERKVAHAQHYLGYTDNLDERLARHRSGNGARLMEVVHDAGIRWVLVQTWRGDRSLERRLKRWHNSPRLCPVCQAEKHRLRGL